MGVLDFTGFIYGDEIRVDVALRGETVGQITLDLGQWDQLRKDSDSPSMEWVTTIALATKEKAKARG